MDFTTPTMAIGKRDLRYGGSSCGVEEMTALHRSIEKSIKTGNWQQGEQGALLEKACAKFLGLKHAILTTSGSSAGLLAISSLELLRGSEVIIPAVTFPTIFNIILQSNCVPVVVDAKIGSYNLDVNEVKKAITKKTRAIIAVHAVGNPCDMPALMRMVRKINRNRSKKNKIYVIEDNCDGWGSTIHGRYVGSFGDISITSFHAAHIVSMGVGGGVFTNSSALASKVRQYRDWGRQANTSKPHNVKELPKDYNPRFVYDKIGYNFQILDLQAAMGRVQLRKTKAIKRARQRNFNYLNKHLRKHEEVGEILLPVFLKEADICWFAFPISCVWAKRESLVKHLEKNGIETRSMFAGNITLHPAYKDSKFRVSGSLMESNYILGNSFWITVHPRLTKEDLKFIVKTFDDFFA